MGKCLFCEICSKNIPADILYEDDELIAFRDIDPQAEFHILLVPKAHIESAASLTPSHGALAGRVFQLAAQLVQQAGYTNGYRVVTNIGADGGQTVQHLHFHVLAGRQFMWPPG